MKLLIRSVTVFLFTLFLISNVHAAKPKKNNSPDFDQYCNVSSKNNFSIEFTINNAALTETVWATKKGGGAGSEINLPLWTNDISVHTNNPLPVIIDQLTQRNNSYNIQLFYTSDSANKKEGVIDYYLYRTDLAVDGWYYISSGEADLSVFNSTQITVGGTELIDYECYEKEDVPELPEPNFPESCDVFPSQLQTWEGNTGSGLFDAYNLSSVKFPEPSTAIPEVGFKQSSIGYNASITGCNSQGCVGNDLYIIQSLYLGNLAEYPVPIDPDYENLSLWNTSVTYSRTTTFGKVVIGKTTMTLMTGEYWFDSLELNNQSQIIVPAGEKVVLHTKALALSGQSNIGSSDGGRILIYGHDLAFSSQNPNHDRFDITGDAEVYADIYSEKYVALNASVIYGSLTTAKLQMTTNSMIYGELAKGCGTEPPSSYSLEVAPSSGFALTCDTQELNFQVTKNGSDDNTFNGDVVVTATNEGKLSLSASSDGVSEGTFEVANGILKLYLAKSNIGSVDIAAILTGYPNSGVQSGEYSFVPFKFSSDTQQVIAAKSKTLEIKVLGCQGDDAKVVDNYDGQNIPFTTRLISPLSGILGSFELVNTTGDITPIDFTDGTADVNVTYFESGKISVNLIDTKFDCSGFDDCPIGGTGVLEGSFEIHSRPWTFAICEPDDLPMDGSSTTGNKYKSAGEIFSSRIFPVVYSNSVANYPNAGSDFCSLAVTQNYFLDGADVYLKAEKKSPSGGRLGTGSSFLSNTNAGGHLIGDRKAFSDNELSEKWYLFEGLYWNEVGSLTLTASLGVDDNGNEKTYLGGTVSGNREAGRFTPHHLRIIEPSDLWDYATGHQNFAYMGQDIGHNFVVQAESFQTDDDGNALSTFNYGLFNNAYKTGVEYKATINILDSDGNENWENVESSRLLPVNLLWEASDWGSNNGQIDVAINTFSFVKNGAILDGPFNSSNAKFGLVSTLVDDVDFQALDFDADLTGTFTGKRFASQPNQADFRYGRMTLRDVGGNQGGAISIPLKVEYWDGTQFTVNNEDNGSVLNSTEYCNKPVWSEVGNDSNVTLAGAATDTIVSQGSFSGLFAKQTNSGREQYKIWLRQGVSKTSETGVTCSSGYVDQPWLQYFWNGAGAVEEDPSAIVTFGIYRGNDRVIFRGENRFTGGNRFPEQ